MDNPKAAKHANARPTIFIDARDKDYSEVSRMRGHYAIRIGDFSLLLSVKAAEAVAWVVLQRQAKRQARGR